MSDRHLPPALFVTWQDHASRKIFPVGRLVRLGEPEGAYEFAYVEGAREAKSCGFVPFLAFPSLTAVYRSRALPPFFTNRVMASGRPDYAGFVRRLALAPSEASADEILARSGGVRATDTVEVFGEPTRLEDGRWQAIFLVRSIRHVHRGEEAAAALEIGQRLYCMRDVQNEKNPRAVALRTTDHQLIGFCPDYLTDDLDECLSHDRGAEVTVLVVNPPPAPFHYRVLCELRFKTREGKPPFRSRRLEPLAPGALRLDATGGVSRVA